MKLEAEKTLWPVSLYGGEIKIIIILIIGSAVCQKSSPSKQQNTWESKTCISFPTKAVVNKNTIHIHPVVNHPAS
jgi:hypothetical protein